MAGKLNGVMPATTPSGWRIEYRSMPGPALVGELALQQMRDAAGELDDLEAALDIALGVRDRLAVLGGEQPRQRLHLAIDELQKLHHHAGAALRIGRGPCRLRGGGIVDRRLAPPPDDASATRACTSPVLGSKTSAMRFDAPFTTLPPTKW